MADAFKIDFDLSGINAALDNLADGVKEHVRPAAQAGAQVLYREVLQRVPVAKEARTVKGKTYQPGTLKASIYQAYSDDNSRAGQATYHISWNRRKAPHGHLIEFGTSRMEAQPFLRPAYDAAHKAALEVARDRLAAGVQQLLRKAT
ncbi:MAG TPA: HK97-gp10 family putative phage morphogenesis protein [Noviherbaspirillum sp.]|jgi:HK97 gp10 family phage protein|uniref:HK97-gp10 family putative phage morphogenesis protein n=1 Tax=Noviherbaspirillum sp. TaxID=1926288 RepID=UPI002DDD1866|nr:HK97-gp10 family putative phage morphogenesis protein [Noviherbaspirillum sp.]HEV2612539.1 HK97-gp10 family putative phage morphogenesis protein [Noviherbaspirillum sp.]